MNVCDKCGYQVISNAMFEKHQKTHEIVVEPVTEPKVEEVAPVIDDTITLHFSKEVEVYINGRPYIGKNIKVKDMKVASEIVRIAREAYGASILL